MKSANVPCAQVPLWQQIRETAKVVEQVRKGASGTASVENVESDLRPGVQALVFDVWRNLGRAEALRNKLASKLPPPDVDALLCVALALVSAQRDARYEAFTLVNQTVETAKRNPKTRMHANFINACLRRYLRERASLTESTDAEPVALWNHPLWWIERLQREQPVHWKEILTAANSHAPMTLRVNIRKTNVEKYLGALEHAGIVAKAGANGEIYLDKAVSVRLLPGFQSGFVSVQDAAAQLAAPLLLGASSLLDARARVLDACAAPGGKTGHLLELSEAGVIALDVDVHRCTRTRENLRRLGVQAQVVVADASLTGDWWDGHLFDAILLDAPCTASGIVRRHPDIRWLRRETDIDQLAALQRKLLQTLWRLVRPGGALLYCTCSVFLAEGAEQVETFLAYNTDAVHLLSPGHLMPKNMSKGGVVSDNQICDHDGFYFALLQKRMV